MKFVIAPDKFKGSLTGDEFCSLVATEIRYVFPNSEIVKLPLADGGDGTLEVVKTYLNASEISLTVADPFFRPIVATYLISGDGKTAFIEMSVASGYRTVQSNELDCKKATTLGTGQLILDAITRGVEEIILGIGGSATNDAGMGVANALGFKFLDAKGEELKPIGENLIKVEKIERPINSVINQVTVKIACDVTNPFYGENGAAKVFAKQKGATDQEIEDLDNGLRSFAAIIANNFNVNLQEIKGAGAAGGLGGGAVAFLNGTLVSGINLVKDIANFESHLKNTDWIITGEGNLDTQTKSGKTIGGVIESAKKFNIPVAAFCGGVELSVSEQQEMGINYAVSVSKGISTKKEALENASTNLSFATFNFLQLLNSKNA
ncbi:glycerate kinase [Croceivirga lutea]|uniref:glycerate kinase n=1 Tax=Croceivirga lutea TaxID=1775167 RepID=UPI00163AC07A|nr:glycerate kinase [Croceivirga lutea]GGG53171.1 glycerate kinase [Croceivirga lutea]